jgi:nucleotide-binding universal stress UspA family protein
MSDAETSRGFAIRNLAEIRFQTICVATDFSETAGLALSYAAAIAGQFRSSLHVLHVLHEPGLIAIHPDFATYTESARDYFNRLKGNSSDAEPERRGPMRGFFESVEAEANDRLQTLIASPLLTGIRILTATRYGYPVDEICQYVRLNDIDLLVLGTHGHRGLNHFLIGSVAERVVRASPCPVLTVRLPRS